MRLKATKMRLKDIPVAPAYLVFHYAYMNGAMDVYPAESLEVAQQKATTGNDKLDSIGCDDAGMWAAYVKLPRKAVWKYHAN